LPNSNAIDTNFVFTVLRLLGQYQVTDLDHAVPQPITELRVDVRIRETNEINVFDVTSPSGRSDVRNASESTSEVSLSVSIFFHVCSCQMGSIDFVSCQSWNVLKK